MVVAIPVAGNRGLIREKWKSKEVFGLSFDELTQHTGEAENLTRLEDFSFDNEVDEGDTNFVTRTRGYFVPPTDNTYQFKIRADDQARLYFSVSGDSSSKVRVGFGVCDLVFRRSERALVWRLKATRTSVSLDGFFAFIIHKQLELEKRALQRQE